MAAISAKVSASSSMETAPMIQATRAAGPASCAVSSGANSQPEPMMPLTASATSPIGPISRFSPVSLKCSALVPFDSTAL